MTWQRPRLAASRLELAKAGFAGVETTRIRAARLFTDASQSIDVSTLTRVQFPSPTVELDTLDYTSIWDATNHVWVVPADARLVRLYGRVAYPAVSASGQARLAFQRSGEAQRQGRQSAYAVAGDTIYISTHTATIEVQPGDVLEMLTDHIMGATEAITVRQFQIEFLET